MRWTRARLYSPIRPSPIHGSLARVTDRLRPRSFSDVRSTYAPTTSTGGSSGRPYQFDHGNPIMPKVGEHVGNEAGSEPNMKQFEPTRRSVLGFAGLATASVALPEAAVRAQEAARRGRPPLKITDVKTILTQPGGEHLVVVKVLTSEPGLHGVGCATHSERPLAVAAAIDQHV